MTAEPAKSSLRYYAILVIVMAFWGASWPSAKIIVGTAPPMTIGFFRFFTASILFQILLFSTESEPRRIFRRSNFRILFLVGLTGIFGYGVLFLTGIRLTTAAQGAIIAGFNPATISLVAHIYHKERLAKRWQYIGFVVAFVGVIFVVGVQALLEFNLEYLIGNIIILGAMFTYGLYSSIGKEAMKTLSPLEVITGGTIIGTFLFGMGALTEEFWALPAMIDPVFWINVLYLGTCVTFIGFLFYFICIKELGATRAGGFINLVPVFGTVFSYLILKEVIYWTYGIGLLLVVVGIVIINFPIRKKELKA
ncbi:MAG: putative inner membrane transporter YhbE [Candidatus Thorarchaeota archaeon AB_25]|nr:MAG: putative inner membrane transporter YhbE [Candidatus Thorarchaeota archaeon AB_25]